jgi:hypothetical protein
MAVSEIFSQKKDLFAGFFSVDKNLSRNLFPPRRFSTAGDSAAFNGTA